ncbi:MAG: carbamoyltransferase HypF [Candidatus Eremiobacteraeota bacterium]|nr:carbamoyltransferase HypF [Candidatus Eremiobacteraeota bacterium]
MAQQRIPASRQTTAHNESPAQNENPAEQESRPQDWAALSIRIRGIVQGVGFRPFVYSLAGAWNLSGYVLNDSEGVMVWVEGPKGRLGGFLRELPLKAPPRSRILELAALPGDPEGIEGFTIRESMALQRQDIFISPDIATCPSCLSELRDPGDRRSRYPFINCTDCGPRFTIIEGSPYDRQKTSMKRFPMCPECGKEYGDPSSRRFHAEPNACSLCGPALTLLDAKSEPVSVADPLRETVRLLAEGFIVAVKGLGGFHLACSASREDSVHRLRSRKYREDKPFALMAPGMESIRLHCEVSAHEETLLASEKRPIVLLKKKHPEKLAPSLAPGYDTLGFMLPYTPLHHLLFDEGAPLLVMTSGNVSDEPICYRNEEALRRLGEIADYFLVHDRDIYMRCDDSVVVSLENREIPLRRSRGSVPEPLIVPLVFRRPLLACGGELKSTFCLGRESLAFLSHHIGDLENLETLDSFEKGIAHFCRLFSLEPEVVACDMHPEYLSTKYALEKFGGKVVQVQHHHAHLAGCLADNGIDEKAMGVIFDGLGYGDDGTLWGGEFLLGSYREYERVAYFKPIPLPGGTKAIKEPWRMALSVLYNAMGEDLWSASIPFVKAIDHSRWPILRKMLEGGLGSPLTSSAGRLFDAAGALLGIRSEITYEGQAAVLLQMAATGSTAEWYDYDVVPRGNPFPYIIDTGKMFTAMVHEIERNTPLPIMAKKFHNTMARIVETVCRNIRRSGGTSLVALSGGVFQNMRLLELCQGLLLESGFTVLLHGRIPPNDGGLSLGQAMVAEARCR